MKKYRLIESDRMHNVQKLYRIQALRDFTTVNDTEVKAGDLGGFVSGEHNLSHEGNCWVANSAEIRDNAFVSENAYVGGVSFLNNSVKVFGNALIIRGHFYNNVKIYDNAFVGIKGWIADDVEVFGNAAITGKDTTISGKVKIFDNAKIGGNCLGTINISDSVQIYGKSQISPNCDLGGNIHISGDAVIHGVNMAKFNDDLEKDRHNLALNENLIRLFVTELKNNPDVKIAYLQRKFSLGFNRASANLEKAKHIFSYRGERE